MQNRQHHHELIFLNAAVGIAHLGRDGQFLQTNPKFCELTGYSAQELASRKFSDITHPDEAVMSRAWMVELSRDKSSAVIGEKRYIHKQGHVVWACISVTPVRDRNGRIEYFVSVLEDITERKLSEDLLRAQREVLELMAENLPLDATLKSIIRLIEEQAPGSLSAICLVEGEKIRLCAAPSFPKSFMGSGEPWMIGPSAGSCGAAAYFRRRVVSTNIQEEPESFWGDFREWILSYGIKAAWSTPAFSKDGKVIGTVNMCWREPKEPTRRHFELVDVATRLMGIAIERGQTERLLRDQQAKMIVSSKLAALGEMAAGLAHEINNPLAIIQCRAAQLSMMVESGQTTPALLDEVGRSIHATTQRISKIIRGLRSFARETEHEAKVRVPLAGIIDETLAFCKERFKSHAIELRMPQISQDLLLECRPVEMSQVLLNLLNNSRDAVEGMEEKWIEINAREEGERVLISVTDSGAGIPEEVRDRIMQPFFTTKAVDRGTGLGLSISDGIVSSHGGTLALDEASPHTRFVISLPMSQGAPA
jgi:PAS domain S-box-containing protein